VLWPLVLRDQFQFAATEYGLVVMVISSICTTLTIASFPYVERRVGKVRTATIGATLASMACCLAFVVLPNLNHYHDNTRFASDEALTNPDAVVDLDSTQRRGRDGIFSVAGVPQKYLVHVVLAIVFEASVRTLEPSLKSILSLTVPAKAQNRSLRVLSTLGGIGGMGGNLIGTYMFQLSKTWTMSSRAENGERS